MNLLPTEIWERILHYLPLREQMISELVCSNWLKIVRRFWTGRNGLLLDNCKMTVLVDEICNASAIYDKNLQSFLNCILSRYGSQMKYIRLEKTGQFDAVFLASIPVRCPKLETIIIENVFVSYRESELMTLPSLSPLVSLSSLKRLHLNSNCAVQIDDQDWSRSRQWVVGTICPVVHLFPHGLDNMSPGITELWLEDIMISSRTFATLCQRLNGSLQRLCLKLDDCSLQKNALSDGLQRLTRLVDLNLGSKRPQNKSIGSLLDDVSLERCVKTMNRLETLSLRGAYNLTSSGVNAALFNAPCGRATLKYLNLNRCPRIDYGLALGLRQRPANAPMLQIFAYLTDVASCWAQRLSGDNCRVIIDPDFIDESVFFGEPKLMYLSQPASNVPDNEAVEPITDSDSSESEEDNDIELDQRDIVVNVNVKM